MKLELLSGCELGRLVNKGEISPTEVIEYFKQRIEERNPSLNAFTYTKFEDAFAEAEKLEKRLAKRKDCGPLAGVPIALKDFLPSKCGWTNSHGGVGDCGREDQCACLCFPGNDGQSALWSDFHSVQARV